MAQTRQLLLAGIATGQRPAAIADVIARRRGGKTKRPSLHGLAQQAAHGDNFLRCSRALEGGLAHDIMAQWSERHQSGHVDAQPTSVHGIEILAITFPTPVDTRLHDVVRNSLDVHQVVHEDVARLRLYGCHTDTAVAHHYGGHAVPWGTGEERIPGDLGVVVGVRIDKTWCQDEPVSVYGTLRTQTCLLAQVGNLTVGDAKRPDKTGLAGTITHASVL